MIIQTAEPLSKHDQLIDTLTDRVKFCETLLRFKKQPYILHPWQRKFAHESDFLNDRICLQKSRQCGGSLLCAALTTHATFINPDIRVLVVSKTKQQAGWIAKYINRYYESHPLLAKMIDNKRTKRHELHLRNGSIIYDLTAGWEGENERGYSTEGKGFLLFDESSYIPSAAIRALIFAGLGCGEIHCSTPRAKSGYFYEACSKPELKYKVTKVPAFVSPRYTQEQIEDFRRKMRPSEYARDVLAEFAGGEAGVFDTAAIERAVDRSIPLFNSENFDFDARFPFKPDKNKSYIYSLDLSKIGRDSWSMTIGDYDRRENTLKVVAYCSWAGRMHENSGLNAILTDDPNTIIRDILRFRERFPCRRMYTDVTCNEYFSQTLERRYLFPVESIHWSTVRKQLMIEHLASCLRGDRITVPNDNDMLNQLANYEYDYKRMQDESERKIYLGTVDDMVASLAMLAQIITAERSGAWGFINAF